MVIVAVAAVLLAICTSEIGIALLYLFSHILGIPVAMGLLTLVIRDSRRRAAWRFWVAAAAGNGLVVTDCVYLMEPLMNVVIGITLFVAVPTILVSGVHWLSAATGPAAVPRRSEGVILPLVLVLGLAPLTMVTLWPLHLAFRVSRPALERLADRVAAGKGLGGPQWAGVYWVVGGEIDPMTGNVGLVIDASPGGRAGFTRLGPSTPPESYALPFVNLEMAIRLGDRWYYEAED
jgi:hypothetical protein